jgi:hypothetical protein
MSIRRRFLRLVRSRLAIAILASTLVLGVVGTVVLASLPDPAAPAAPSSTTLDTSPGAGSRSIITVGTDGFGLIAYNAGGTFVPGEWWAGTGELKVAHCKNRPCTSAGIVTVANNAGISGAPGSGQIGLAIGRDGFPFITYYKPGTKDLVAVHCTTRTCSSRTSTAIVTDGNVGRHSSVVIGPTGRPIVAYFDDTANGLKVARCANVVCSSATVDVVDDPAGESAGEDVSIAIGPDGNPVMAYGVDSAPGNPDNNYQVRVAHCPDVHLDDPGGGPWTYDCDDTDSTPTTKTTLGGQEVALPYADIVVGADGLPFVTGFFKAWHCESPDCAPPCFPIGDPECTPEPGFTEAGPGYGGWGGNTSPAVGADGLVTFLANNPQAGPLVPPILHCTDLACSRFTSTGVVGLSPAASLTVGVDGKPLISNQIGGGEDPLPLEGEGLEVIHCTNAFCTPYFRRR